MNDNIGRISLMGKLFSKMSKKLKLLDLLASIGGTLSECFAIAMYMFCALAIADTMNAMAGNDTITSVPSYVWGILAIVFGLCKGGFRYLEQYLNHNIAFHMLAEIRHHVYEALERLAPAKLEDKRSGDMLSLMTSDIETLEVFYAHTLSPMVIASLTFLTVFITSLCLEVIYPSLVYMVSYLVIGLLVPYISFKVIGNKGEKQRAAQGEFSAFMMDSLDCTLPILTFGKSGEKCREVEERTNYLNKTITDIRWKNSIMTRTNQLMVSLASLSFATLGILALIQSGPSSNLYAMICILVLPGSFRPAMALGALPGSLSNTFASARRFLNLVEEKPEVEDCVEEKGAGTLKSLTLKNISFSYPDNKDRLVIDDVSLAIGSKGIIGIKGPSGNGKSTLLKLMLRHRNLDSGSIEWNGENITEINTSSLRSKMAMMEQDTYLFKETLRENMQEARPNASDEEVMGALRKASIDHIVETLPNGLDTYIDNESLNISTGEKQRIGLARILLRNPDIILLDEPTSNVDSMTEKLMLDTFKELSREKSIVMVSHSSSALAIADVTYSLEMGKLSKVS